MGFVLLVTFPAFLYDSIYYGYINIDAVKKGLFSWIGCILVSYLSQPDPDSNAYLSTCGGRDNSDIYPYVSIYMFNLLSRVFACLLLFAASLNNESSPVWTALLRKLGVYSLLYGSNSKVYLEPENAANGFGNNKGKGGRSTIIMTHLERDGGDIDKYNESEYKPVKLETVVEGDVENHHHYALLSLNKGEGETPDASSIASAEEKSFNSTGDRELSGKQQQQQQSMQAYDSLKCRSEEIDGLNASPVKLKPLPPTSMAAIDAIDDETKENV
jgi:hypothetical protein